MNDGEHTTGFIVVPPEGTTPSSPTEQFGPLTESEREQFLQMRSAMSGLDETLTLHPMRVMHEGVPRVALVAVKDVGDEVLATPLALLIDGGLFAGIDSRPTKVQGPVLRDGDSMPRITVEEANAEVRAAAAYAKERDGE